MQYIVPCILYGVHCSVQTHLEVNKYSAVQSILYGVQCTMYSLQTYLEVGVDIVQYSLHCTIYTVQCIFDSVHCTVFRTLDIFNFCTTYWMSTHKYLNIRMCSRMQSLR